MVHDYDSCSECLEEDRVLMERSFEDETKEYEADLKTVNWTLETLNELSIGVEARKQAAVMHLKDAMPALKRVAAKQLQRHRTDSEDVCVCGRLLEAQDPVCPVCNSHRHGRSSTFEFDADQAVYWWSTVPKTDCVMCSEFKHVFDQGMGIPLNVFE